MRTDTERHETARQAYETAGLQILELANRVFVVRCEKSARTGRLVRTLVSNSTFDRGNLTPAYIRPFDVFARGSESGDWLSALDDFRNWLVREAA